MNTVLLTWTICPNAEIWKKLQYKSWSLDPEKRRLEYMRTIIFYIAISNFDSIVFVENSNYNIWSNNMLALSNIASIFNKKIEILQFEWNNKTMMNLNYWYWEGEIIDYAYDNSSLIKKSESRYKITWRYIIKNINSIIKVHKNLDNLFFRNIPEFSAINTAFFKTNNKDYKYLYNLKENISSSWLSERALKYVFYEKIISIKLNTWNLKEIPLRMNIQTTDKKENFLKRNVLWYEKVLFNIWLFNINNNLEKFIFKLRFPNRDDFVK